MQIGNDKQHRDVGLTDWKRSVAFIPLYGGSVEKLEQSQSANAAGRQI